MSENYIVINGKKAELTPEQLKALGLKSEIKSPFERVKINQSYFFINGAGEIKKAIDINVDADMGRLNAANYCTDREMMEQRVLHETLNRLLWRYSMEHGGREIDTAEPGWYKWIGYSIQEKRFKVYESYDIRCLGKIYFRTREIAENAIVEIIKPFKEEHPDFEF